MAAKKPAGCPHRELLLLSYVVVNAKKACGYSVRWCVDCGALCVRDDEGRPKDDVWQLPGSVLESVEALAARRSTKGKKPGR